MNAGASRPAKRIGDEIEQITIDSHDLERVDDASAEWHDARATALLDSSSDLLFASTPLVATGTPIEIKGAIHQASNGGNSTTPGRIYVKKRAHEQLLDAGGMYLVVVYEDVGHVEPIVEAVVPASIVDEFLRGRWYDVGGGRSEDTVAKLGWPHLIDPTRVGGDQRGE